MSSSNFCANCGARLIRKGWRLWLRGAICDDCAIRPGVRTRGRAFFAVALLGLAAFAFGRFLRPSPPALVIQRVANSPLPDAPLNLNSLAKSPASTSNPSYSSTPGDDETVYLCGARTQKGRPCRRRVHVAGERCFQHKGRTAMVPLEKLVINREAKKK